MLEDKTIDMPCLGRPFSPGMLYDCRNDRLVPGITLWSKEKLENALKTQDQANSQCELIMEDTYNEKSSKLGVDASLKLSLLGGLFKVEGSAHYLNNRKTSTKQVRVSMKYSMTDRFDQLTMNHLAVKEVEYPEIFDKDDATHVVTGVLYGADVVFTFDQDVGTSEEVNEVGGALKVAATIFIGTIEGAAEVKFSETDKELYNRIKCTIFGDVNLDKNPSNLLQAMEVYRDLPTTIKTRKTVPKKVWLYPLKKLDSRAARLVRQISDGLVSDTEKIIEALHEAEQKATTIIQTYHPMFVGVKRQVDVFKEHLFLFKKGFENRLLPILPEIRGKGASEEVLVELIKEVHRSPYAPRQLLQWVNEKQQEVDTLNFVIQQLKDRIEGKDENEKLERKQNVTIAKNQIEANRFLDNWNYKLALALVFNVAGEPDSFMKQLDGFRIDKSTAVSKDSKGSRNHLIQKGHTVADIRKISLSFCDFVNRNLSNKSVQFLVYAKESKTGNTYVHTQLHQFSEGTKREFTLPTVPGKPWTQGSRPNPESPGKFRLLVEWDKPKEGSENVIGYKVQRLIYSQMKDWSKGQITFDSKFITPGQGYYNCHLTLGETYIFRACSVCETGESEYGEPSDPILFEVPKVSAPGKPRCKVVPNPDSPGKFRLLVEWDKPKEGSENVIGYKVQRLIYSQMKDWTEGQIEFDSKDPKSKFITPGPSYYDGSLTLGETYILRACSVCETGESEYGEPSDPVLFQVRKVPGIVPGKPRSKVVPNPESPGKFRLLVEWDKPKEGSENVIGYKVQRLIYSQMKDWSKGQITFDSKDPKSKLITPVPSYYDGFLTLGETYILRACSVCETGESEYGEPSDQILFEMPKVSAPGKPWGEVEPLFHSAGKFALSVRWERPKEGLENVICYKLQGLINSKVKDWTKSTIFKTSDTFPGYGQVEELTLGRTYVFRACSVCETGESEYGEPSDPILFEVPKVSAPGKPRCKVVPNPDSAGKFKLLIEWDPKKDVENFIFYEVQRLIYSEKKDWEKGKQIGLWHRLYHHQPDIPNVCFEDMALGETYIFRVCCHGECGAPSDPILFEVPKVSAPGKPRGKVVPDSDSPEKFKLVVEWEKPKKGLENVIGYKLEVLVYIEGNMDEMDWNRSDILETSEPYLRLDSTSLRLWQTYLFRVCSMCKTGESEYGEPSVPINFEAPSDNSIERNYEDLWVTVRHHSPFPPHAVRALDRELHGGDSTTQNNYVALW